MHALLLILNIFFWVFHTVLILFNVLGWIWKPTRKWNLMTLGATAFSWLLMGLRYGIGYCLCTDWHFQVRAALGIEDHADTYIQLLLYKMTGLWLEMNVLNPIAGVIFGISVVMSVGLNIRDWRKRKTERDAENGTRDAS
jgi:hypothetical protein